MTVSPLLGPSLLGRLLRAEHRGHQVGADQAQRLARAVGPR